MKIPKHIRLAYLISQCHKRIIANRNSRYAWKRQDNLVKALNRDEELYGISGFFIGKKLVRINESRSQAKH